MGNREYLLVTADFAETLTNLLCHLSPQTGVDFVKDGDDVLTGRFE